MRAETRTSRMAVKHSKTRDAQAESIEDSRASKETEQKQADTNQEMCCLFVRTLETSIPINVALHPRSVSAASINPKT